MSPYAQSLVEAVQAATDEVQRAKAEVLLACYWARVGDSDSAEAIRQRTRELFPSGKYGDLTVLHMCLDGLLLYYSKQSPAAVERIRPAHALAATYRFRTEQAFSAAWLAHIEFNRDQWVATADALASCRAALDRRDRATEGRMSLVVADALLFAGQEKLARSWYTHAHSLFTSLGDHAAIEAHLYNRAALRLHSARLGAIHAPVPAERAVMLGGEIASATNYQRLTELSSLDYLLDVATASHRILTTDYPGAQLILTELLNDGSIPTFSGALSLARADLAMCQALCGEQDASRVSIQASEALFHDRLSPDDRALVANSLGIAFSELRMEDEAKRWRSLRDVALTEHEKSRSQLISLLSDWAVEPQVALAVAGG